MSWRWSAAVALAACSHSARDTSAQQLSRTASGVLAPVATAMAYAGRDADGVPNYARGPFAAGDSMLLLRVYGVVEPSRLYVSDSTAAGVLKYDTRRKTCRRCYVDSYRVGFISIRNPGESWDALQRRVAAMPLSAFPASARVEDTSTADLDPTIRGEVDQMLADARRAGVRLRIAATYRSPLREAYLMAIGRGRTHTLTSLHSYGRAIDLVVDDGNPRHARTRADWIGFRRWVTHYRGHEFAVLGAVDATWDWRHVEVPGSDVGFASIGAALARARACTAPHARVSCDFAPHLPASRASR